MSQSILNEIWQTLFLEIDYPADMRHWPNAGLMLVHRQRRWPNNKPALGQRRVITGHLYINCIQILYSLEGNLYDM